MIVRLSTMRCLMRFPNEWHSSVRPHMEGSSGSVCKTRQSSQGSHPSNTYLTLPYIAHDRHTNRRPLEMMYRSFKLLPGPSLELLHSQLLLPSTRARVRTKQKSTHQPIGIGERTNERVTHVMDSVRGSTSARCCMLSNRSLKRLPSTWMRNGRRQHLLLTGRFERPIEREKTQTHLQPSQTLA